MSRRRCAVTIRGRSWEGCGLGESCGWWSLRAPDGGEDASELAGRGIEVRVAVVTAQADHDCGFGDPGLVLVQEVASLGVELADRGAVGTAEIGAKPERVDVSVGQCVWQVA